MSRRHAVAGVCGAAATLTLTLIAGAGSAASATGLGTLTTTPTISHSTLPSAPDGKNGWFVSTVSGGFVVNDPDHVVTSQTGCGSFQQSTNTSSTGVTFTCQISWPGGSDSDSVTIKRDATPPFVSVVGIRPSPLVLHSTVHVDITALENQSGIASKGCTNLSTATVGGRTAICHATDIAGNVSDPSPVDYTVEYARPRIGLGGNWHVNRRVYVAFKLTDAAGHAISDAAAAALGCRVKVALSGAQSHSACPGYQASTNLFREGWRLGAHAGRANLTVSIGYPNSTVKTIVSTTVTIAK